MVEVEDSVHIDAAVDEVFSYMDVPENQAEITPSLSNVETVEVHDDGTKLAEYTYSMAGVSLEGQVEGVERVPNERIVFEMRGAIQGEIDWGFEEDGDGTRVTYAADYEIPVPVLERVVEPFVRRYNERELTTLLQNLKDRMEADDVEGT